MAEKTLGRIAQEAFWNATGPTSADDWEVAVSAAIAEYEARRWKAIATAPRTRQYILAYSPERKMSFQVCWDHEWGYWQMMGGGKCTMEFTLWTALPAPPKEADNAA